jgi:hypothetical protein
VNPFFISNYIDFKDYKDPVKQELEFPFGAGISIKPGKSN